MNYKPKLFVTVGMINGDQFIADRHGNAKLLLQFAGNAGFNRFAFFFLPPGTPTCRRAGLLPGAGQSTPPQPR